MTGGRGLVLAACERCLGGLNRLVNLCVAVRGGDEQRFVLAARHVHALVEQVPEVPAVLRRVTAAGHVPVGHQAGVEEERHHASDTRDVVRDARLLRGLMQAQFERQRMFTSCGWFFEQFDRIEPRNNLKYAAHALTLTEAACGIDLCAEWFPLLDSIPDRINQTRAGSFFAALVDQFRAKTRLF